MPEPKPTPSESLQGAERAEVVRKAVAELPEDLRTPLILCEYEELSHAEIGKILDCTSKAVETRIYRARNQLRKKLAWLLESTMKSDAAHSYWVHDLSPFLVRFSDSFGIRYYGLAYVLGFLIAVLLLHLYWRTGRSALDPKAQSDLLVAVVIGVILGGRLGYFLFYSPATFLREPLAVLRIWDGGMSSHGGFIGVCLALLWVVRKHKLPWRSTADILVTLAPPGLFLGRTANFINGELWGKVTYVPWAVIFPKSAPDGTPGDRDFAAPSFAALRSLARRIVSHNLHPTAFLASPVTRERPGQLAGEFLILYAAVRAVGEVFREPDASLLFGLSRGTFYSSFLVVGGLILFAMSRRKPHSSAEKLGG